MFGGAFVLILVVAVLAIDPAFFYPRLSTDPLLYYLKGLTFAETGHTAARVAVNRPPFDYVALPGVLRAPFMIAFKDFDLQLRAIQLSNIVLVAITSAMSAFVLSWVIPRRWHWLAIGFTFGFVLLFPHWEANVFAALADAPYAAFSLAFIIVAIGVICSERPLRHPLAITAAVVLFLLTFLVRFTAPFLLIYLALLAAGRARHIAIRSSTGAIIGGAVAVGTLLLVVSSWGLIERYLYIPKSYLVRGSIPSMGGNLIASALPSQIVPVLNLGWNSPPMVDTYHVLFDYTSVTSLLFVAVGVLISATTVLGMWVGRNRLVPEIWYGLIALVTLGPIIQSASRYLMAYQPFFWIFFYLGLTRLLSPFAERIKAKRQLLLAGLTAVTVAVAGMVYMRAQRIGGTGSFRRDAVSIAGARSYVNEVSSTFRSLRNYLETLPRDRTLLVSEGSSFGRWKVISGIDYYRPDSTFRMAVATHDTYLLVECGTLEVCQDFPAWDARLHKGLARYGNFSTDLVFSKITPHGKARVYRIRNAQ